MEFLGAGRGTEEEWCSIDLFSSRSDELEWTAQNRLLHQIRSRPVEDVDESPFEQRNDQSSAIFIEPYSAQRRSRSRNSKWMRSIRTSLRVREPSWIRGIPMTNSFSAASDERAIKATGVASGWIWTLLICTHLCSLNRRLTSLGFQHVLESFFYAFPFYESDSAISRSL